MLKKGDVAVYGNHGLCQVKEVLVPPFLEGESEKLYYMMSPATDRNGTLYVPVEGAEEKMRDVITEDEAHDLLEDLGEMEELEITTGKRAEAVIVDVIRRNRAEEMMCLVKGLHKLRAVREREGKKLASMNERYLMTAEKLLYSEMAFSLQTETEEIKHRVGEEFARMELQITQA